VLARAMCASLSSTPTWQPADEPGEARCWGIDLALAQKIAGRGSNKGDVTIEWDAVTNIIRGDTVWRSPRAKYSRRAVRRHRAADALLQVLAPQETPVERSQFADQAARAGRSIHLALVDLYGLIDAGDDQGNPANGVASDLRTAYTGGSRDARIGCDARVVGQNSEGLAATAV